MRTFLLRGSFLASAVLQCGSETPTISAAIPAAVSSSASSSVGTGTGGGDAFVVAAGGTEEGPVDASTFDGRACAGTELDAKLLPSNLLFVIDVSSSMGCNLPPIQTTASCEQKPEKLQKTAPSKWETVKPQLKTAIAKLPSLSPNWGAGVVYFPAKSDVGGIENRCAVTNAPHVPVAVVDAMQLEKINKSLDEVKTEGWTPAIGALWSAYDYMHATLKSPGNDFVIFVTDGTPKPECHDQVSDPKSAAEEFEEDKAYFLDKVLGMADQAGIHTFVIGVPGSEGAREFLSTVAKRGKTALNADCVCSGKYCADHASASADAGNCHFDMTDSQLDLAGALSDAFAKIATKTISCNLDVPTAVGKEVDYSLVNVTFTPSTGATESIPQDNSKACNDANGWQYNANKTHILLCGAACEKVKADIKGQLKVVLGCQTTTNTPQ